MGILRLAAATLVTSALLAVPSAAQAAIGWGPCQPAGFECGTVAVPVDRTGAVPGVIALAAKRVRAATDPTRTAVLALAGGPGQAALPIAEDFAASLGPALAERDLLVYDQRGTGASNPLRCAALGGRGSLQTVVGRCAAQIGPARAFFKTADSVADIEALRVAGEYDKLVLYGVSYGTRVAEEYAAAHPDHVAGLVLDSVVTPEGPDALRRSTYRALPRVLANLCANAACKGISSSVFGDLGKVARKLARHSAKGPVYDDRGKRYTARLTEGGLVTVLLAGDLNPTLRAELPGSLRAALTGDVKPLLRLSARSSGLENRAQLPVANADSDATFLTTTCEENATLPWTRNAPVKQRSRERQAIVNALDPAMTAPFTRNVALGGVSSICLGYQPASAPPVPIGALPAVPTLILDGAADLRTPLEDAQSIQRRIPGAQLVEVPDTGHSTVGSDFSDCTKNAIATFFAGQPVGACPAVTSHFSPTPRPPLSLNRVPSKRKTKTGRTLEALRLTVNDGNRQVIGEALALGAAPSGAGGLRGGAVRTARTGLRFVKYTYVPGVTISGTLQDRGTSSFHIRGSKAARGSVRVTGSGRVTGTLGGKRVAASFAQSAAFTRRAPLTLRQAVARGRVLRATR